jgi:hypothetical protein
MFKGHPWDGEIFGGIECLWYLHTNYMINVEFELDYGPFIGFCKREKIRSNDLLMKVCLRLSERHLPQYVVARNRKFYPARYSAGYVRTISPDRDMVEWVAVSEQKDRFKEVLPRDRMNDYSYYLAYRWPRLAFWLARRVFPHREVKDRFTLLISRNPMRELGRPVVFHGTGYPCFFLLIPFGSKVKTVFGYPHAFGNMDRYTGLVKEFIEAMEKPETIPRDLVEKNYRSVPPKTPEDAAAIRNRAPRRPPKELRDKYN